MVVILCLQVAETITPNVIYSSIDEGDMAVPDFSGPYPVIDITTDTVLYT